MTAIKWYLFSYDYILTRYRLYSGERTVNCAEYTVNCNECTVNCALDIINRMMSYILYLSLRWSYEVGSCTIAIRVMTAIKHYLFSYRLDFNQNSLNYTVANAQSTVPNAQSNVPNAHSTGHWTLLTEWCLTSYISVYDCHMKLGVEQCDQCEMTAIKWYLFCYRVDFNQKSLNYTVVNAQSTVPQSTVPNAESTVHWTLLTECCLTSYISVYDGRMKLGFVTLWSVWDDSYQMIST